MIWFIFLGVALVWAEEPNQSMLEQYIEQAITQNPTVQSYRALLEAEREGVRQAGFLPEPTISVAGFVQPIETKVGPQRAKVGIQQPLPWFGTRTLQQEQAVLSVRLVEQQLEEAERQLIWELKRLWYPMIELSERQSVLEAHQEILQTVVQIAERRLESGRGSMVDLIRLDIQQQEIAVEIAVLEQELASLKEQFNLLSDADINHPLVLENHSVQDSIRFEGKHPSISQFDTQLTRLDVASKLVEKQYYPKFGVGLDYIVVGKDSDMSTTGQDAVMPMVSMSIPIYRNKVRSELSEIEHRKKQVQQLQQAKAQQLQRANAQAEFVWRRGEEQLTLYQTQRDKTKQSMDLLLRAYTTDETSFEGILALEQQLLTYERKILITTRDMKLTKAEQEWLRGGWNDQQ